MIGKKLTLLMASALMLMLSVSPLNAAEKAAVHTQPAFQPDNQAILLYNEGVKLIGEHDIEGAAGKFREAIGISPKFADAHSNLGTALVQSGKYDEAMVELQTATELKPTSAAAWGTLATCYQSLGRTAEAIQAFKTFLKLSPNAPEAPKVRSGIEMLENELKRTAGSKTSSVNAPDFFDDATQNGIARWPQSRQPITICITGDPKLPGFREEYINIVKQAFADWEEASQGLLKFEYVTDPKIAKISCSWTDDPKQMISSAEGGHALVIPDSKGILKVNIILLTVPPIGKQKLSDHYARRIDLHEIGHALGILGHSRFPNDIMFSTILPADVNASLTNRDKNTLMKIYTASADMVKNHPLDMTKMMLSGDPNSNVNQVLKLNSEAAEAMKNGKLVIAIQKLESAQKLDPGNDLVNHNLGSAYANCAMMAATIRNWPQAESYFQKALPLLEKNPDHTNLIAVLKGYAFVLKVTGKPAESAKLEARAKSLSSVP